MHHNARWATTPHSPSWCSAVLLVRSLRDLGAPFPPWVRPEEVAAGRSAESLTHLSGRACMCRSTGLVVVVDVRGQICLLCTTRPAGDAPQD